MKNYNTILTGGIAKISALSLGIIDKYEYLTRQEILPSNQSQIIEQGKFTYFHLGKPLEKQTKSIEDGTKKKQNQLNTESKNKP